MFSEPKVENRNEQHYVAIRTQATMNELDTAIPQGIGEVAAWLGKQGLAPAGAPFVRYLVIDMEALLEIEVGFPIANAFSGDDRIHAGVLPAGRYASLVYTGIDNGIQGNWTLLKWGAKQGLVWDSWQAEKGEAFGARFETFLTNPDEEPDRAKWETEVAIRVKTNESVTTIDPRYSDPNAKATPWEETRRVLETAELFWLSTVRADGRPHVTPVVAVWHDGALYFSTADTEQKARNLRGNPHVILTTGCNTWNTGLDVVVEGNVVRIADQGTLERLASVWATKWDGRWKYEVRDGSFYHYDEEEHTVLPYSILVFEVKPTKVYAHGKGDPFSHTRHQF